MSLQNAIFSHLQNDSNVTDLLGEFIGETYTTPSIFLRIVPKSAELPAITLQQVTGSHVGHLGGPSGVVESEYQINMYTEDQGETEPIADALRSSMNFFRGTMGSDPDDTADVLIALLGSSFDDYEVPNSANEKGKHSIKQSWTFTSRESVTNNFN